MQPQQDSLAIGQFETLSDDEIRQYVLNHEKEDLAELLLLIKKKRAVRWEDRAILQMVEKSPLTFWASNRAYTVVLWAGTCKETYHRDLMGKQFPEIMSVYERSQAMADSLRVIEADGDELGQYLLDYKNYYTKDMQGTRTGFSLITNSLQLVDDETGEKFYAEIGLPIDLEEALDGNKERQKEFDEQVNFFKAHVDELGEKFSTAIKALRMRINSERALTSEQKDELRTQIDKENKRITANLGKRERAFIFDKFLQDNEDDIYSSLQKLNCEIKDAINKVTTVKALEQQENPTVFELDINHMMELVRKIVDGEISKKTSASMTDDKLQKRRTEQCTAILSKRDELLRELTEMRESVESSPNYALVFYRSRLVEIEPEMRKFIDQTNRS